MLLMPACYLARHAKGGGGVVSPQAAEISCENVRTRALARKSAALFPASILGVLRAKVPSLARRDFG
jgi:hypothetical protein